MSASVRGYPLMCLSAAIPCAFLDGAVNSATIHVYGVPVNLRTGRGA